MYYYKEAIAINASNIEADVRSLDFMATEPTQIIIINYYYYIINS